jgi:hypothetical protein
MGHGEWIWRWLEIYQNHTMVQKPYQIPGEIWKTGERLMFFWDVENSVQDWMRIYIYPHPMRMSDVCFLKRHAKGVVPKYLK